MIPIHSIPTPVVGIDRDGIIAVANVEAHALFGYEGGDLVGRSVDELVPEAKRGGHREMREGYAAAPVARPMASDRCLRGARKDGELLHVRIALLPLDGVTYAFVFDLTEVLNTHEHLARVNADLEQFAYAASHDLQEPLRAIGGYVGLVARKYYDLVDDQGRLYLTRTTAAVDRLRRIIEDLLAFSRAGGGGGAEMADVRVAYDTAFANLSAPIAESGATVTYRGQHPIVAFGPGQLASVMQNLLSNALKYRRDGVPPVITVRVVTTGTTVAVLVDDNGVGVPPEYSHKLFQVFQRLHGAEYTGTGIGLAVVKRAVERYGGRVYYEPLPSGGSRFGFTTRLAHAVSSASD